MKAKRTSFNECIGFLLDHLVVDNRKENHFETSQGFFFNLKKDYGKYKR